MFLFLNFQVLEISQIFTLNTLQSSVLNLTDHLTASIPYIYIYICKTQLMILFPFRPSKKMAGRHFLYLYLSMTTNIYSQPDRIFKKLGPQNPPINGSEDAWIRRLLHKLWIGRGWKLRVLVLWFKSLTNMKQHIRVFQTNSCQLNRNIYLHCHRRYIEVAAQCSSYLPPDLMG